MAAEAEWVQVSLTVEGGELVALGEGCVREGNVQVALGEALAQFLRQVDGSEVAARRCHELNDAIDDVLEVAGRHDVPYGLAERLIALRKVRTGA